MGMNLLQQKKFVLGNARAELIKVGKNLPRLFQNFDKLENEEEQFLLQGHIGQVALNLNVETDVSESPRC